jgi:hypothetical protein
LMCVGALNAGVDTARPSRGATLAPRSWLAGCCGPKMGLAAREMGKALLHSASDAAYAARTGWAVGNAPHVKRERPYTVPIVAPLTLRDDGYEERKRSPASPEGINPPRTTQPRAAGDAPEVP